MHLRRLLRLIRLLWHMLLSLLVAYPLLGVLRKFGRRDFADYQHIAAQWWSRNFCRILNLQINTQGEISARPTLFVANHISWLDIVCLSALLKATFVAKEEVRHWPVFGGLAARVGALFLKRGEQSPLIAEQMTARLMTERHVLFFPEGTSSGGESVQHFHARLYQAAVRAQADVQAVAVTYPHPKGVHPAVPFVGEDELLPHLWVVLGERMIDVSLHFYPPLNATDTPRRELAECTRSQILSQVNDCRMPTQDERVSLAVEKAILGVVIEDAA